MGWKIDLPESEGLRMEQILGVLRCPEGGLVFW